MAGGILSGPVDGWRARRGPQVPEVELAAGMVVTHLASRFKGAVVRTEGEAVLLRSPNSGMERLFRLLPGAFAVEGRTVTLRRPRPAATVAEAGRTASGSIAAPRSPARVARASRILVEGIHDAELVEKVWGDDLRAEGVVVERLDGVDVLESVVAAFRPGPDARLGVLVDHLVPGSKEARVARSVAGPHVLVTGTPFVDVWQAVRPQVAGLDAWPVIPRGQPWKEGICDALGVHPPGALWKQLLGRVRTYADLEPDLVGAVEALIDFVCPPPAD